MITLKNGSTIGKATVIVDIVPKGNVEIRPAYSMKPTQIAIHNTGNSGRGANAKAHNTYIHNMANLSPKDTGYASWHLSVDDKNIYQHIPFNETAWHTGDGSGVGSGNMTAIGIEICENVDMKDYHQAEENAIALAVLLMKEFNVSIDKVRPHQSFSGKYCPRVILKRDGSFDKFKSRIKSAYGAESPSSSASKPSPKPQTQTSKKGDTKTTSIVDYLKSINVDSSLENRKKLAKENGIVGYTGTVAQNNNLLEKLRSGASKTIVSKPKSKPKESSKSTPKKTVINGIKTIGEIEIIGVSSSAIIMDVPNRNLARNIGTVPKGDKKPITGSVKGKNNDKGYWEVVHKGERAYISGQFGKLVK